VTLARLMPPPRRLRARAVLALMSGVLVLTAEAPSWAESASASATDVEFAFVELVNHERSLRGLIPLRLNPLISEEISRPWSTTMARRGDLAHSGTGADVLAAVDHRYPGVSSAGENVGYAPTVARLHAALMDSPGHRKNLLDPAFGSVGLGIATSDQRVWVTQTFFAATDTVPPPGPVSPSH